MIKHALTIKGVTGFPEPSLPLSGHIDLRRDIWTCCNTGSWAVHGSHVLAECNNSEIRVWVLVFARKYNGHVRILIGRFDNGKLIIVDNFPMTGSKRYHHTDGGKQSTRYRQDIVGFEEYCGHPTYNRGGVTSIMSHFSVFSPPHRHPPSFLTTH